MYNNGENDVKDKDKEPETPNFDEANPVQVVNQPDDQKQDSIKTDDRPKSKEVNDLNDI